MSVVDATHLYAEEWPSLVDSGGKADLKPPSLAETPSTDCSRSKPETPKFVACLSRPSSEAPWGMKIDFADDRTVHVCELRLCPGAAQMYNNQAPQHQQLQAGDYIVSVNGVSAATLDAQANVAEAFRDEMMKTSVELEIVRPYQFEVDINREGDSLGLELNFTQRSASLVITAVKEGAVQRCATEVQAGDRIIAIDGQTGTPDQLLEFMRTAQDPMRLQLTRPGEASSRGGSSTSTADIYRGGAAAVYGGVSLRS